jgi:hypothetical protein
VVSEKKIKNIKVHFDNFGTLVSFCISDKKTKQTNTLFRDPSMNIPNKIGSNWSSGFREDD